MSMGQVEQAADKEARVCERKAARAAKREGPTTQYSADKGATSAAPRWPAMRPTGSM